MPRLSEHERSGAFGMLKAGVRVSDIARYHNCHPSAIQHLRDCNQATWTVKDRRRFGQPRMATSVKRQLTLFLYRQYLRRRYPFWPATVSARRIVGLRGYFISDFLIKPFFYLNNLKSFLISRQRDTFICAHAGIFFKLCILITHYIRNMKMYLSN